MRDGPKVRLDPNARLDLRGVPKRDRAARAIAFTQKYCRIVKGPRAGELVRLREFQREIVRGVLAPGVRQGYVSIPRKNGKSYLAACLALFGLVADEEQGDGREVYCIAGDLRQARYVYGLVRRMVQLDPRLSSVVQVYAERLVHETSDSILEPLPADAELRLGLSPTLTVYDEVAIAPNDDLWLSMSLAMGAREAPLLMGITTPGWSKDSLAWRLTEHGRKGEDKSFYIREWSADDGCKVTDETQWAKSNPGLGDWLSVEDMRSAVRSTPEHAYRRFRLGQWTKSASAWIRFGVWEQLADPARIVDCPVVLSFDGSASGDSTALVYVTVEPKPHVGVVEMWEHPPDNARWRVPRGEVDAVLDDAISTMQVLELTADPSGWRSELETWSARYGATRVVEFPPTRPRMGPATDRAYQLIMEGKLSHDGDSRLASHVAHATPKPTQWGDQLNKPSESMRIDGAVAMVCGLDRAAWHVNNPKKASKVAVFK